MAQNESLRDAKKVIVELTMTVDQARQVVWTWNGITKPVGEMLDANQINYKDLTGAILWAGDPVKRAAARTLLANWLGQPTTIEATTRFGPEVISGTNYLEEQALDRIMEASGLLGVAVGLIVMFAAFGLPREIGDLLQLSNQGRFVALGLRVLVSIVVLAFGIWYFYRYFRRKIDEHKNYRQGAEGEERVLENLRTFLDQRWSIFHNLVLPGRKEDVDLVLVGPGGVWAVQVKSSKATLRANGMKWEVNTKKGWVSAAQSPAAEVSSHAKQLNIYLQQNGVKRFIERAIALATDQPISYFESSEIPVWLPPTIEAQVKTLSTSNPPTDQEIQKIVGILKRLNDLRTNNRE